LSKPTAQAFGDSYFGLFFKILGDTTSLFFGTLSLSSAKAKFADKNNTANTKIRIFLNFHFILLVIKYLTKK